MFNLIGIILVYMNKYRFFTYLLSFTYIVIVSCQSNNHSELIFDFKNALLQEEGWTVRINSKMRIDSLEKVNNEYSLMIEQGYDSILQLNLPIFVLFHREILLSNQKNADVATLSIESKVLNLDKAAMKFFCIDKEDNIVFCDSIDINNENNLWNIRSISFPLKATRKIVLGIYALGYDYPSPNALKKQGLWLNKITLQSTGELLDMDKSQFIIREKILSKHLFEINIPFDSSFCKIDIPDDKMIIGIGEAVHGSKTINQIELGLVRNLILKDSCKLVLFELNMFQLMLWNQYIQGNLSENYINTIKKGLLSTLFSSEEIWKFLVWLRKYNSTTEERVNIQGIVPSLYNYENQLFHYLHAFYNPSTASTIAPLLKKIKLKTLSEALSYAKDLGNSLKIIMGNREYLMFLYALNRAVNNNVIDKSSINHNYQFLYRDIPMAENVSQFVSLYLHDNQKACIIAHNDHVNKKLNPSSFPHYYPMGYYLNQRYGDKYYVLGMFPGKGSIFGGTDNNSWEVSNLKPILPNSLEDVCMQIGLATFFYPTSFFKNDLLYYRSIGNKHFANEYESGNLKVQMDGIVFVDEIYPIHTKKYDLNEGNIMSELFMKEFEILKNIEK